MVIWILIKISPKFIEYRREKFGTKVIGEILINTRYTSYNNPVLYWHKNKSQDFPGGPVVKNPPANAGDTGSIPGPGRLHIPTYLL